MKTYTRRFLTEHLKREIVYRRYELGHSVAKMSRELYVNPCTISSFCIAYLRRGRTLSPMVENRGKPRRTPCNNPFYDD
jgi:hypothetical protein